MAAGAKIICVEFDGSVNGLTEELGRIVVTGSTAGVSSLPVLAHKSGMTPVVRVGWKQSSEEGMFDFPYGVAVDYQTGNIYVSDVFNQIESKSEMQRSGDFMDRTVIYILQTVQTARLKYWSRPVDQSRPIVRSRPLDH